MNVWSITAARDEIDQRVGLCVDIVTVEQYLGILQHLTQAPSKRRDIVRKRLVGSQRIQRISTRGVRRVILHVIKWARRDTHLLVKRAIRVVKLARQIQKTKIRAFHIETHSRNGSATLGEVRKQRREQPLDSAGLGSKARNARDIQVRCLWSHQEVSIQKDRRIRPTSAIHPDWNPRVASVAQIPVHPERDVDILLLRQKHVAHRYWLHRFFWNLSQYRRAVQPNLGAFRRCKSSSLGSTIVTQHVVHRRYEISVAEPFRNDTVNARNLSVDGSAAIDSHNRPDPDWRIESSPEMELVRSIGLTLRRDHPAKWLRHAIDLRNCSQSRIPYAMRSHRASGNATGEVSASTHRDISSARAAMSPPSDASIRTRPNIASRPRASRSLRYQLITGLRRWDGGAKTELRSPRRSDITTSSASPSANSVW